MNAGTSHFRLGWVVSRILVGGLLAAGLAAVGWAEAPGSTPAAGPASQPGGVAASLPDKYITTTGPIAPQGIQPDGVVQIQGRRGRPFGDVGKFATNDKTVVVLLNGKTGKLGDLHPSQFVTVYQAVEGGPAVRIEPATTPAAERRVADLNGQIKSVTVEFNCSAKADPHQFTLVFSVAEQKRADKAHVYVLDEKEMDAVLRYFALEGFLANGHDFAKAAAQPRQPANTCLWTIRSGSPGEAKDAMNIIGFRIWDKDTIGRLDGLRSVLPAGAIKELDWLVKNMGDNIPAQEVTP